MKCQFPVQHSRPRRPIDWGCLSPSSGEKASLYRVIWSGPHKIASGRRDARQMASEVLRPDGQVRNVPSGVLPQLMELMRAPAAPPLRSQSGTGCDGCVLSLIGFGGSPASPCEASRLEARRPSRARSTRMPFREQGAGHLTYLLNREMVRRAPDLRNSRRYSRLQTVHSDVSAERTSYSPRGC
jgi:hypothetical protein